MADIKTVVETNFRKLALSLQSAVEANEIWRELSSSENYNKYQAEIDEYGYFFESIVDISRSQVISGVARFSDRSQSGLSVRKMFKQLRSAGYNGIKIDELESVYEDYEHLWEKIRTIRGGATAHTSKTKTEKETYEEASIKNDELSLCVNTSRAILIEISDLIEVHDSVISKSEGKVKSDCKRLLANLLSSKQTIDALCT